MSGLKATGNKIIEREGASLFKVKESEIFTLYDLIDTLDSYELLHWIEVFSYEVARRMKK